MQNKTIVKNFGIILLGILLLYFIDKKLYFSISFINPAFSIFLALPIFAAFLAEGFLVGSVAKTKGWVLAGIASLTYIILSISFRLLQHFGALSIKGIIMAMLAIGIAMLGALFPNLFRKKTFAKKILLIIIGIIILELGYGIFGLLSFAFALIVFAIITLIVGFFIGSLVKEKAWAWAMTISLLFLFHFGLASYFVKKISSQFFLFSIVTILSCNLGGILATRKISMTHRKIGGAFHSSCSDGANPPTRSSSNHRKML